MQNVHGIAVAGGSFPAEIWRRFMEQATRYSPAAGLPAAEDATRSGRTSSGASTRSSASSTEHDDLDDDDDDAGDDPRR